MWFLSQESIRSSLRDATINGATTDFPNKVECTMAISCQKSVAENKQNSFPKHDLPFFHNAILALLGS